jgi:thiol-disulfide isomerase/thioredoxin
MNRFSFILLPAIVFILLTSSFLPKSNCFELEATTAEKMDKLLKNENKKYKFLYFFTTWCYECNESLDHISQIQSNSKLSKKYDFINIALDDDLKKLKKYSKENNQNKSKIYYFGTQKETAQFFLSTKIDYNNAVPYYCILDNSNKIVIDGYFELSDIEKYLEGVSGVPSS